MKKSIIFGAVMLSLATFVNVGCNSTAENNSSAAAGSTAAGAGQSGVSDDVSERDVVKVAIASKDHTTLVKAVQAAELVDVLSNAGPFTVFAPTNDAFNQLPAGTVEELLKPEKKADLQNILQYHVAVASYRENMFREGQVINMVNGGNVTMTKKGDHWYINDAEIVASVKASNGIVYVINKVLLPK
jgi:uncharacterized surface protein with fasciclin (FAS1) repeats